MSNIIRSFNGRSIRQRSDGYLSATDMCQSVEKRFHNWHRLDSTKEYLKALQGMRYSDVSNGELIQIVQGGTPEFQGTWVYRKVALRLSQWLSPEFAIQVDDWVEELLLSGKVSLSESAVKPKDEMLFEMLKLGVEIAKYNKDDRAMMVYGSHVQNLISTQVTPQQAVNTLPEETWLTVSEVLEREGFPMSRKDIQNSLGQTGKLVKAAYLLERDLEPKTIQKTVGSNHRSETIKLYPEDFFSRIIEVTVTYWEKKGILIG
jgi:hypothetical protein